MRKRAPVHPFDVALGLVWLTIIFVGILYLVTRGPADTVVPVAGQEEIDYQRKADVLRSLKDTEADPVPSADERMRVLVDLERAEASDDRASVYPLDQEISTQTKLDTLRALREAQ